MPRATNGLSTGEAVITLLNGSVGVGVLGLPYAFARAGWAALLIICFCAAATYYTANVIVRTLADASAAAGKGGRRAGRAQSELNYDYLGELAFGRIGRAAAAAVQLGELLIAAVAVLLLLAANLTELSAGAVSTENAVYVGGAAAFALSVSRPALLAKFSLLSLAVVVAQVAVLVAMGASSPADAARAAAETRALTDANGAMEAFGSIIFCFGGHSMLPATFATMADTREAPAMLTRVFTFMVVIYCAIGGTGYAIYGPAVADKFIDNFPADALVTRATRLAMAYNLLSTLPLVIAAIAQYFAPADAQTGARTRSRAKAAAADSWLRSAAVKGALVALTAALTLGLGDRFDLVVSVGGASLVSAVSLIFPLALNLTVHRRRLGLVEASWNLLLLAAALAFALDGTTRGLKAKGLL